MEVFLAFRFLVISFILFRQHFSNAVLLGFEWKLATNVMYVGSYSQPDGIGNGIAILVQDQHTGKYEYFDNISSLSPSALTMDRRKRYLYSVNEANRFNGERGFVSCYELSWSKTGLTYINNQSSLGWQPNFVVLDPSGQFLMVANYGTSNVVVYRLRDGRIGEVSQNVIGYGEHAHQIVFDPKGSMVAIPYLGSDLVYFYTLDKTLGKLHPYRVLLKNGTRVHLRAVVSKGAGPRHLVYSKDGRYFYVIGELLSTVTVFRTDIDEETGQYSVIQVVDLLPVGYNGRKWAAAIVIHPNGRFLYASERGIHRIAIFKINLRDGKLDLVKNQDCGKIPRHMVIRVLRKNDFKLCVTNEGDHAIQVFKIRENGDLDLDYTIDGINSPTYLQFYP